jgi:CRISPR-associated protein (TIGR02584 family)
MQPHAYPRRILLAVTGLSPQILTETLYALTASREPAFVPTQIHLVTTAEGAERARLTLLSVEPGWYYRYCRDYGLASTGFDERNIHVLTDPYGEPLADIRTDEENEAVADALTELVRGFSADEEAALHVSIAGGRKTMGYYAGYALSLFGRAQDRMSHVLVSAPYESNPEFFYPTPYSRVIYSHPPESRPIDARDARVSLAEIPFVRLREELPRRLLEGRARFSEAVAAANRTAASPVLVIDTERRAIRAAGEAVELAPAEFAFYLWMAERCTGGKPPVHWTEDGLAAQLLAVGASLAGRMSTDYQRMETALAGGMSKEYFEQRKSRANRALRDALGERAAQPYLIASVGGRPRTGSGLQLEPEAIRFARIEQDHPHA